MRQARLLAGLALGCLALYFGLTFWVASRFQNQLADTLMERQLMGVAAELTNRLRMDPQVDLEHLAYLFKTLPRDGDGFWHLEGERLLAESDVGRYQEGALHLPDGTVLRTGPEQRERVLESLRLDSEPERFDLERSLSQIRRELWAARVAYPHLEQLQAVLFLGEREVCVVDDLPHPGFPGTSRLPVLQAIGQSATFLPRALFRAQDRGWPESSRRWREGARLQVPLRGQGGELGLLRMEMGSSDADQLAAGQARQLLVLAGAAGLLLALVAFSVASGVQKLVDEEVTRPVTELSELLDAVDRDGDGRIDPDEAHQAVPRFRAFLDDHDRTLEIARVVRASTLHLELLAATLEQNQEAQRQLQDALARLEEASQAVVQASRGMMLAEVGAWVAHDLNNKLQAAYSITKDWIARGKPCPPKHLGYIHGSLEKAIEQIDQLRHLSKPRQDKRVEELPVTELLHSVRLLVARRVEEAGVELVEEVEPELVLRKVDPGKLQDMLVNLVLNACDAITEPPGKVRLAARTVEEIVVVEVEDNGCGLSPEDQSQLFQRPFHTTKGERGTGLGLRIVAAVVQEHGGRIEVESTPGEGTRFTIRLPREGPSR